MLYSVCCSEGLWDVLLNVVTVFGVVYGVTFRVVVFVMYGVALCVMACGVE